MSIGKKLSPILEEIEDALWESESNNMGKPEFTMDGFRASIKIFMSAMMDKIFELQDAEDFAFEDKLKMSKQCGEDIKKLVSVYTGIDTTKLYE